MTDQTFEEKLRIEDEAIFAARRVGALAYKDAVRTGEPAECPYNPETSGDPLDDMRMTAWYDGIADAQARHGGEKFEALGSPIVVTLEAEHTDGTATYSIPAAAQTL